MLVTSIAASPGPFTADLDRTALIVVDMQRDLLEPGSVAESRGNNVALLSGTIAPCRTVLNAARLAGLLIIYTRETRRPDPAPAAEGAPLPRIGAAGVVGRILPRGEDGHDVIRQLYPADGEIIIDKPGKGAFYPTDLDALLANYGIECLVVCGVTTELGVHATVREATDRGYRCLVLADCCASYFPEFHETGLRMISAQGGIFGCVSTSRALLAALATTVKRPAYA